MDIAAKVIVDELPDGAHTGYGPDYSMGAACQCTGVIQSAAERSGCALAGTWAGFIGTVRGQRFAS